MQFSKSLTLAALSGLCALSTFAQSVSVTDAWARATVINTGSIALLAFVFGDYFSQVWSASTPVAGVTEIHEMKMDKDVMRMSAVAALDLPAGKAVELKPGGYHVMLMDLKNPLTDKSTIPMTLTFEDAKGQKSRLEVQVPVRAMTAMSTHKH